MTEDGLKVKVALIGCGRIAKKHASLLGSGRVRGAELVAVCDIDSDKAREIGSEWGVPWFVDMDLMVSIIRPDLIALLTPSGDHGGHVLRLSQYETPLLVEKPLTLRLEELDACVRSCKRYKVPLGEVKQNRYNLAVQHLKTAMDEGRLGRPRLASVRVWWQRDADYYADWHGQWEMAGGVLANQAIHHIDLLCWLLGPVYQVSAFTTYSQYTEVETGLVATLKFVDGCIGTIQATTLANCNLEGSLSIIGEKGSVELGGFAVNEVRLWAITDEDNNLIRFEENPPDVYGFGHKRLYEDCVKRLADGSGFPVDADDARQSLEVVHAIYQAVETGKVVRLDGDYAASRLGR